MIDAALVSLTDRLADAARPIARKHFRTTYDVAEKADSSPVTPADTEIEATIRAILASEVPDHGILGEELGGQGVDREFVWVIDPIDGTKAFVTGKPLFGTLIALLHHGSPVIGMIDQPITCERWLGADGHGTTFNGRPATVGETRSLAHACCYTANPEMFDPDLRGGFAHLRQAVHWMLYNADCYAYGLLACGYVDLVLERGLKPHDYCALVPIVRNAGGYIGTWRGTPLGLESDGTVIAASSPELAASAIQTLVGK